MSILKDTGLFTLLIAVLITLLVLAFNKIQEKPPLTKIEIEESDKDIVTIWLDNGVVVKADKDEDYWKDQIVIDPLDLTIGDQIVIYNLSKDAVRRSSYLVLKVEKDSLK